jgi:glycosyltransferase involved in cell wall biosynthesis
MRIAQVAPLFESVPPRLYGGTERVVSYLTEELIRLGHEVTLFASADSLTAANLVSVVPQALRLDESRPNDLAPHVLMLEEVMARAEAFDVVHFHLDFMHLPFARRIGAPRVTTQHGRLDQPHLSKLFDQYGELPMISISDAQRKPLPQANWCKTIHHGLPNDLYELHAGSQDGYFAFIGRISPEKRVDRAIEVAKQLGVPLKIAAKVDPADAAYFERDIKPLIDHPLIEFIGEIGESDKDAFLGGARALLFMIDWPEPFGLAMIEAMACGTPVVAFRCGSVPEVIEPGVTGFIVEDMQQALAAAASVHTLSRRRIRAEFERRFTAERMARDHLALYADLIERTSGEVAIPNGQRSGLGLDARAASTAA